MTSYKHELGPVEEGFPPEPSERGPHGTSVGRTRDLEFVEDQEGIPFRRYLAAVRRYKWVVVLATVLGIVGAYGAWTMVEPQYVAQGSLWVSTTSEGEADRGPIQSGRLLNSYAWVELLRSYAVLDTVVRQEKLYVWPAQPENLELFRSFRLSEDFRAGSYRMERSGTDGELILFREGSPVSRAALGEAIGVEVGFRWTPPAWRLPPGSSVQFTVVTPRDAARSLSESLEAQMAERGNFINLSLPGEDPDRIASVLNSIMDRHVELSAELKRGNLEERTEILREQLDRVETELRRAERELESFRVETVTLPDEDASPIQPGLEMTRDPVFARYFDMSIRLDNIRRDQSRLRSILATIPDQGVPIEGLELIPSVESSTQIQQSLDDLVEARRELRNLRLRYTDEHPDVQSIQRRIGELERVTISGQIRELITQLEAEETDLNQEIQASGSELSEIPIRSMEEARLRRRVAIAENLYTELRSRYEEASLAEASSIPDVRILDRATPPEVPEGDERARIALLILLASVGAGLVGTVLLERHDPRVRYPDQIEQDIGLEILGTIPRIKGMNGNSGTVVSHEAFRDLRTRVDYAFGTAGPLTITLTGPSQGDGKTFVTTALALSFARMGRRTLVIDGDTRRGNVHEILDRVRKPGLTEYLCGEVSLDQLVEPTDYKGLDLIPSGSRMARSPELLTSPEMGILLTSVRRRYDVILIDSPPLEAGSDAAILGSMTGNLMLVLRSGKTNSEQAQALLYGLERLPIRLLGAILNDYRPDRLTGSYRYNSSYTAGYEAVDEQGSLTSG